MSTRATIHFTYPGRKTPVAIVYRHSDGYPDGLGKHLETFVAEIRGNVPDNRFDDPSYLAAKWVVWDVMRGRAQMLEMYRSMTKDSPSLYGPRAAEWESKHACDFLGVGILSRDPDDIEYRYTVVCDGIPTIKVEEV
jgi:hypothetical protein